MFSRHVRRGSAGLRVLFAGICAISTALLFCGVANAQGYPNQGYPNKPGASTIVGAEYVARAAPDGYTLRVAGDAGLTHNLFLHSKLLSDPRKDFESEKKVKASGTKLD